MFWVTGDHLGDLPRDPVRAQRRIAARPTVAGPGSSRRRGRPRHSPAAPVDKVSPLPRKVQRSLRYQSVPLARMRSISKPRVTLPTGRDIDASSVRLEVERFQQPRLTRTSLARSWLSVVLTACSASRRSHERSTLGASLAMTHPSPKTPRATDRQPSRPGVSPCNVRRRTPAETGVEDADAPHADHADKCHPARAAPHFSGSAA